MKVRTTTAGTGLGARLTAASCGMLAILASAAISACTTSSSSAALPTSSSPSVALPTSSPVRGASPAPAASSSRTAGVGQPGASASPSVTPSATPSATPSVPPSASPAVTESHSTSPIPTAPPATGGGGTAGFQDTLLLGLGGAAILVGAGSIAYRRKVIRNR